MATALILTPDPNNPGGVSLTEYPNLDKAWLVEGTAVLAVKQEANGETTYYAPGAWHSFSKGKEKAPRVAGASRDW